MNSRFKNSHIVTLKYLPCSDRMENVFRVNLLREKHGRLLLARALEGFRCARDSQQVKRQAEALYQRKLVSEGWAAWKEYTKCAAEIAR